MPLVEANDENTLLAAGILRRGGLVVFPTETVYGLGGDAFNAAALVKIFEVKNRPRFDPLIVHIAAVESLENVIDFSMLDSPARKRLDTLAGHFWPGPLTLVLPRGNIPDLASSGLPTVAVRIPANETARQLIALSTGAVAAPSANPFGYLSPSRAEHVMEMLGEKVDIILDGGPAPVGIESTVLDICHGQPRILRPGGVPQEAIEALIGAVAGCPADGNASSGGMVSPGLLMGHYAPGTPLLAHKETRFMAADKDSACLFFDGLSRDNWLASLPEPHAATVAVLSETGNVAEAASRLFEILHELDNSGIKQIHAQFAPETGLGRAINDRLCRASARR
jgi:L-threonylcarbamoyladenylate synthase